MIDPRLAGVTAAWVVALCFLVIGAVIGAVLDHRVYVSDEPSRPRLPLAGESISRAPDPGAVGDEREGRDDEAAVPATSPAG